MTRICRNGHIRTTANTYTSTSGRIICRRCEREKQARNYARDYQGTNQHRVVRSAVDREA